MESNDRRASEGAGRWALGALSLCLLLASLGTSIVNVSLPAMTEAFHASFAAVQWVVLAYLLAITATIVAAGRLGDVLGRRRLLLGGIVLFSVASLACAAAPTLGTLIVARGAQGIGAAVMMALALAIAADTTSKSGTGSAMGWLGSMSAVGTALGPVLGGLLTARFGWPALFLAGVPAGVLAFALAARTLPEDRPASQSVTIDGAGTLLLAAGLVAYSLAMTSPSGRLEWRNALLAVLAALVTWLLVRVEARVATPMLRLSLLRDRVNRGGFAMSFLVTAVVMATLVVGPFYLARALALDAAEIGLVMAVGPIVAALAGIPAGRVVDRVGAGVSTSAGLRVMTVGAVLLAAMPTQLGVAGYATSLAVLTAGYAWFQAANNTAVMTHAARAERGVTSGLLNLGRNLGLVTGASLMGTVFAAAAGGDLVAASPDAIALAMRATFVAGALLLVIALAIARAGRAPAPGVPARCMACDDTSAH